MRYPYRYMVFVSGFPRATLDRWTLFAGSYTSIAEVRDCARRFYDDPRYADDKPDVYVARYCSSTKAFNSASFFVVDRSNGRLSPVSACLPLVILHNSPDCSPFCR